MEIDLRFKKNINKHYLNDFNFISNNSINEFNKFFESLSVDQSLDWWLSSPASRYNLSSPFFHNFCIFKFLEYLKDTNNLPKSIIIDSDALNDELKKFILKKNININIKLIKYKFFKLKSFFKNYLIFSHQILFRFAQLFIVKLFIYKKKIPNNLSKNIIIDKYIFPSFVSTERYYNGLKDNLNTINSKIYFVPTLAMFKISELLKTYLTLNSSSDNYFFKESYYSLGSIIYSLFHFYRKRKLIFNNSKYNDIEFLNIINEELNNDSIAFFAAVEGFLTIEFIKKIKHKGFKFFKIIDWYENQTVDKAWNYGFNTYFPDTKSLGYKGMAPSQMLLSEIFTLDIERKSNLLPKKIGVIGSGFQEKSRKYNSITPIIVCPAFRFNYLWQYKSKSKSKSNILLFALPISIDQSIQILSNLKYIDTNNLNFKIYIKPHPTTNNEIYIKYLKEINVKKYKIIDLPTNKILPFIEILIGGMSSISLESICLGIKTIIVANNSGLNYFTIPSKISKKFYKICNINDNLFNIINEYEKEFNQDHDEVLKLKKSYFEPINSISMDNFIN